MSSLLSRVAGAPISWGVCEVPGWGHQMRPSRVLAEMAEVGLSATEFGPAGFLPDGPEDVVRVLSEHGLRAVGGFVPVVLHEGGRDVIAGLDATLDAFSAAGGPMLVLAADTGRADYDARVELDDVQWKTLLTNLDAIAQRAGDAGVVAALHPHVGTIVERETDVARVLDGSSIPLCLDTGHLLIGGTDPVALTAAATERIAHAHLKDVDAALAERVRAGEVTYSDAVGRGMYHPLGQGDLDIAAIVSTLEAAGYQGWYVLEQDVVLAAEPPAGQGPLLDVRASLAFLDEVSP